MVKNMSPFIVLVFLLLGISAGNDLKGMDVKELKIAKFENGIMSNPEDGELLFKTFSKTRYKVYTVNKLGSFYIDKQNDIIKDHLRNGNRWEESIIHLIETYAKPGTIVIDLGAHIGTHTLTMSKCVGEKGRVIAFEPQIKLFSELVMNLILNKRKNVIAYRCAVGDGFRRVEMNPSKPGNEGGTKLGKEGDRIEMVPLDSLNLNNVSMLKIDVENFEYEVLLGAKKTISRNRPVMVIEIMGNIDEAVLNRDQIIEKTLLLIESMGYRVAKIQDSDWIAFPLNF